MIKLELSIEDVNKILTALSQMPYAHVADLMPRIQIQAAPQAEQIIAEAKAAATAEEQKAE